MLSGKECAVVAGTATAGIPWAAWIAAKLNKPMVYIRSGAKGHGKGNQIEGGLKSGAKVCIIEDLINTGGSSISAVEAVRNAGGDVTCTLSIMDYGLEKAKSRFSSINCPFFSLTTLDILLDVAVRDNYITAEEKELVLDWRRDPENWGK